MSASPSGFALRENGTCQANEVDCGVTINPYRVCCPALSFCPSQYSVNVRPSKSLCDPYSIPRSLFQFPTLLDISAQILPRFCPMRVALC